ncbi:MAG: phosphoglucosamine mutase [Defluviitaleaceae bacterium]|nr:phosphoglucosamine mutase [Defluviitaleaceae bacterium]
MKLFGTDGVRGEAGNDSFLTPELAYKLGLYTAHKLKKTAPNNNEKLEIIIGTDTRISSDMLKSSVASGIMAAGINVVDANILPTPALAYLVKSYGYLAGVMISASHNDFYDNGIKFFNSNGYKLSNNLELEIEKSILENEPLEKVSHESIGTFSKILNLNKYSEDMASKVLANPNLKICIDTANGAAYNTARQIFKDKFGDTYYIADKPNGININKEAGSTNMETLRKFVLEHKLDLGIALDGDGDRMLAIDSKGNTINGDELMLIYAKYLHKKGKLSKNTLVSTIMSNSALSESLAKDSINIVKTSVGDRYVLEEMLSNGYNLGGEDSGHIIFLDEVTTGDGLFSAIMLLRIITEENKPLHNLNELTRYPQITIAAPADDTKKKTFETPELLNLIEQLKQKHSAITVRPSGTEPVIRITIEGKDEEEITKDAQQIRSLI